MKNRVVEYIEKLIFLILVLATGFVPLLFTGLTTEYFEIPKLIFLVVTTFILYGLWVTLWLLKGEISIKRTPLDVPMLLLLVVVIVSTIFSSSKYVSIYGSLPEVHGSAVSWITYILLYFVAASNINNKKLGKIFLQVLVGSTVLVSIVSIISFLGVYLPFDLARSCNFTTTGSTFSTASLILMLLPLTSIATVEPNVFMPRPLAMIVTLIFSLTIVFIGSTSVYIIFFLVFFASLYLVKDHLDTTTFPMLLTPFALSVLTLMLVLIPFSGNRFNTNRFSFPKELQLPFNMSWEVSISSFADSPVLGTGPSTFIYNFTKYKPMEFNKYDYWNFKFGAPANEIFQVLGTLGIVGILSWGFLYIKIFIQSKKYLVGSLAKSINQKFGLFIPGLAVSGMVMLCVLLIHSSTIITSFYTFVLMAVYFSFQRLAEGKQEDFSVSIRIPQKKNKSFDVLPPAIFVFTIIVLFFLGNKIYKVVAADYFHRMALVQAEKDGSKTYEYLQRAEKLNSHIDLYRIDMAQTNLALANALVSQKGPTASNPEGNLTDEDMQTIQTLIVQAVNEAKAATILASRSSRNWEVLALVYRNISGVAENSLAFSLDAYGRAIENDPFNPSLRLGVGMIYYSVENYDQAIRFFTDSINLKTDYVKGYYNLAVALKDKGDLEEARLVAEQVISFIKDKLTSEEQQRATELLKETWVRDYSTATQLLDQIKDKIDTGESQENEWLKNTGYSDLDVQDLEKLPEVATPDVDGETQDLDIGQIELLDDLTPTPF